MFLSVQKLRVAVKLISVDPQFTVFRCSSAAHLRSVDTSISAAVVLGSIRRKQIGESVN